MAVTDAKTIRWPQTGIPYVIAKDTKDPSWVKEKIDDFNRAVGRVILLPLNSGDDVNYALITIPSQSSTSPVGQRGKPTKLFSKQDETSFFHELGHLCGLRHENMHDEAPEDVKAADSSAQNTALFAALPTKPSKYGPAAYKPPAVIALTVGYDANSIMRYGANPKNTTLSKYDIIGLRILFP
jgi:hypothetical protein